MRILEHTEKNGVRTTRQKPIFLTINDSFITTGKILKEGKYHFNHHYRCSIRSLLNIVGLRPLKALGEEVSVLKPLFSWHCCKFPGEYSVEYYSVH